MCGRIIEIQPSEIIRKRFNVDFPIDWKPRYNAAPSENLPVILSCDTKRAVLSRWGIQPAWMKDRPGRKELINARAETLLTKPTFKHDFLNRRCLVIADGFYEWQKVERKKIPYRITLKDESLFAFAGLWQPLKDPKGRINSAFVIITTEPNELMQDIHNRMPVILRKDHERLWLNSKTPTDALLKMMLPYPSSKMKAYEVSTLVNSPSNDIPAVIKPVSRLGV